MRSSICSFAVALLLGIVCFPVAASAHDDPIVTVRVLCNGFNVLDTEAVLGEISDSATLNVDRPVHGLAQIEAWVQEQMDNDLRIEITDIGTPQRLSDGYTLNWTGRFSRQDWRQTGTDPHVLSNLVVIHNGRITEWTAKAIAGGTSAGEPAPAAGVIEPDLGQTGMPTMAGMPISLVFGALIAIGGAAIGLRTATRR